MEQIGQRHPGEAHAQVGKESPAGETAATGIVVQHSDFPSALERPGSEFRGPAKVVIRQLCRRRSIVSDLLLIAAVVVRGGERSA